MLKKEGNRIQMKQGELSFLGSVTHEGKGR